MGYGNFTPDQWSNYKTRTGVGTLSVDDVYTNKRADNKYLPKNFTIRESRDSDDHPNSTPIIIALDVTGSMKRLLDVISKRLSDLVTEIINRQPVVDPQIMFNAVGDYSARDNFPLQATQFESDIKIAEQLIQLYFEQGGGGNGRESYHLPMYLAAKRTSTDNFEKRGKKGFLFIIGDDGYQNIITKEEIANVFGDEVEDDMTIEEMLAEAERSYEVFYLFMTEGETYTDKKLENWRDILGERAIKVTDCTKIPEIIVSLLEAVVGRDVDKIVGSWDGTTAVVVQEAIKGLSKTSASGDLVKL